jgi:hypothetical protein
LINSGATGIVFEVTPEMETVWKFANPFKPVGKGPPKAGNTLFRATRYAIDHPAFQGKTLIPGKTLVEVQQELDNKQANEKANSSKPKTTNALR